MIKETKKNTVDEKNDKDLVDKIKDHVRNPRNKKSFLADHISFMSAVIPPRFPEKPRRKKASPSRKEEEDEME